jgi:hypothetical protein
MQPDDSELEEFWRGALVRVVAHSGVNINDDAYDMHGWIGIVITGGIKSVRVKFNEERSSRWMSTEYLKGMR